MKAVVKTKPGVGIEVLDVPMPQIKPNEVLLKVHACGICGSDVGIYEWRPSGRFRVGIPIELPRIIGHEPSGIAIEVGSDVKDIKPGDRFCSDSWGGCGDCYYCRRGNFNLCQFKKNVGSLSDGAMAEYVAMPAFNLYRVPESISLDEAAVMEPLGVAVHAFETLVNFKAGDDIVILGPGPIGLLEAMVAKASGAGKIFVVGLRKDKERLKIAQQLGFRVINSEEDDALNVVKAETNGIGVDVVFNAISHGFLSDSIKFLKKVGQLVLTSSMHEPVTIDGGEITRRELVISYHLSRNPSSFYRAISLVANGRIDVKPIISHKMKLEDADTGFKMLQRSEGLKILLEP